MRYYRTPLPQAISKRNQLDLTAVTLIVADVSFALDRELNIQYVEAGDSTFRNLSTWNSANNPAGNALSTRDSQLIGIGSDEAYTPTGSDIIKLADDLYGGAGADTLDGKGARDYLEGGTGAGTYIVAANSGTDTILDAGGQDTVQLAGRSLNRAGDMVAIVSNCALGSNAPTVAPVKSVSAANVVLDLSTSTGSNASPIAHGDTSCHRWSQRATPKTTAVRAHSMGARGRFGLHLRPALGHAIAGDTLPTSAANGYSMKVAA